LVAGTAVQLSANATDVSWSVDSVPAGSTGPGTVSRAGLLVAPVGVPFGRVITVTVRSGELVAQVRIEVVAAALVRPAPGAVLPTGTRPRRLALAAVRTAGWVAATAIPARSGRLQITLLADGRRLRQCAFRVKAGRNYACRTRDPRGRKRVTVVAKLRGRIGGVVSRRVTA